ncbi:MAG TPA: DUF2293 domain-containing protein [Methanomicrobia archaeon]|nr:DUF2293 domain-containing protein [Methanomicrobia archaeon]
MARKKELVVFIAGREGTCSDCGKQLARGDFLKLEGDKPLCMDCADLDHLAFLPSGDAALTRRATKYSHLSAVVVTWSSTRKRYERQGILVEPAAIARAAAACSADADLRAARREKAATVRAARDKAYISRFALTVRRLYPACPAGVEHEIAEYACLKYSGRVGRSAAAKELDEQAIQLAVRAHIRHRFTTYDELLMDGWYRDDARSAVRADVEAISAQWRTEKGA